jgi:hypothetical protein
MHDLVVWLKREEKGVEYKGDFRIERDVRARALDRPKSGMYGMEVSDTNGVF